MEKYTFEEFEDILNSGYQVYFTYLKNRYLLFKTTENCYTQELVHVGAKNPPARSIAPITRLYTKMAEDIPDITTIDLTIPNRHSKSRLGIVFSICRHSSYHGTPLRQTAWVLSKQIVNFLICHKIVTIFFIYML